MRATAGSSSAALPVKSDLTLLAAPASLARRRMI